jgi:hypothetical protein
LTLVLSLILAGAAQARDFPEGFLWGPAISAFQTEAGGRPANADRGNDWWVWSRDAPNIAAGRVSGDRRTLARRERPSTRRFRRIARSGSLPARNRFAGARPGNEWASPAPRKEAFVYIGIGTIVLILILVLLIAFVF